MGNYANEEKKQMNEKKAKLIESMIAKTFEKSSQVNFNSLVRHSLKMWGQYTDMIRDFYGQYDKVLRRPLG